jgi:hypothetical protein
MPRLAGDAKWELSRQPKPFHSATFDFSPLVFVSVPLRLKENALDGLYRRFRFVLTLIQFGARTNARTTWREAREESTEAQQRIAHTVVNRAAKFGWWDTDAVVSVSLRLLQFSCLNHGA